jgi:hypothetical protein
MADKSKNTKNSQSTLFRQLTRLFSGPIVNYKRQSPRRLKARSYDKYKSRFKSASGQSFKKSAYNINDELRSEFYQNQNRVERYVDFDQMEYTPEIASALDIYADEMTTSSDLRQLMSIYCPNEEIKLVLENLFHDVLNLEFNLFGWCRAMCKFGDFFLYLDLDDEEGIKYVVPLPANEIERLEGEDKTNPNYIQYQWNRSGMTFENWQVCHFRVLGNDKYVPYGTSILEPARRIWRQLTLLEDAMMAYRIVRSPERKVFYIDTGNIPPEEVEQYMQRVMTQMKRNQIIDVNNGRVDLRYNPMSVEEDYWIPVRGQTNTRIESLPGGNYTSQIEDVKYLRDKLFSALKVPASYLSRGEGSDEDKTTLAQKDIRFARTIQRLQKMIVSELRKVATIHLFTLGYRGEDLVGFELKLNNPSKIAELQELEHWRTKFDVAGAATEGFFSKRWVAENVFSLSEEEMVRMKRELFHDKKYDSMLEKAAESAGEDAAGAGGGIEGLGDLGGDDAAGGEELGGDELGGEGEEDLGGEAGEEPAGDEGGDDAGALLAAPGKRDVDSYLTPRSKGKRYTPVKTDKRFQGARRRSYSNVDGYKDLKTLSKGIYENLDSTYKEDEERLFQTNFELKQLIENLENSKKAENDK